jgi:ABC-type maltose transport system permease subunit
MGEFLKGPIGSWLRVWLATALTVLLADLATDGVAVDWKGYAIAGAVAILPLIIAYLNPQDTRFGAGSTPS